MPHVLLEYAFVPEMLERRTPYREAHIAHVMAERAKGTLILSGPFTDEPPGAAFVFASSSTAEVEAFVAADPYVGAGLVTGWGVREWGAG